MRSRLVCRVGRACRHQSLHFQTGRPTLQLMPLDQKNFYDQNGYVHLKGVFSGDEMDQIASWVQGLAEQPPTEDGKWMHHLEETAHGEHRLSRTENIVSYHPGFGQLLMSGRIPALVGDALGEAAFLYKEKINYKYPGGAGYRAHQDAPAYKQLNNHATCLVSIDDATVANGCLEFAATRHKEGLIGLTDEGVVSTEAENMMDFTPVETQRGDIVIFSSYIPHRSRPNTSATSRNLLYLTYNAASEGYLRDEYYRHKRHAIQGTGQISLIKHFQGVTVGAPDVNQSNA